MSNESLNRVTVDISQLIKFTDNSSVSAPTDSNTLFLYKKPSSTDLWMYTLGGGESKVNGGGGGGTITDLPDLNTIRTVTLASTVWPFVSTLNQNVATTSSPTFVNITGTLSTVSQPNITTLAGITSIQGTSLASTVWSFVSTLNQNVATTSSPIFSKITYSGTASNSNGLITSSTTFLNIKTSTVASTGTGNLFSIDTTETGSTAGTAPMRLGLEYTGAVTRTNCSWLINTSEPSVGYKGILRLQTSGGQLSLGNSSFGVTVCGRPISDTKWAYVENLQDLSLFSSPSFYQITLNNNSGGIFGDVTGLVVTRNPTGEAGVINAYGIWAQRPNSGSGHRISLWAENMFVGLTPVSTASNGLCVEGPVKVLTTNDNTNGNITNGSYVPTTAVTSGTFTVTVDSAVYIRNINYIEVSVYASLSSMTSGSTFSFTITLPISKTNNFTNLYDVQGVGNSDLSPATAATTIAVSATTGAKTITCTLKSSTSITTNNVVIFKASYIHD